MSNGPDGQIAKSIYLKFMGVLKNILTIEEVRLGGRNSPSYKLFKRQTMDEIYNSMSDIFKELEADGTIQKCPCGTTIRAGYKPCERCNGAGHCNSDKYEDFIKELKASKMDIDDDFGNR